MYHKNTLVKAYVPVVTAMLCISLFACHKSTQLGSNLLNNKSWINGYLTDTIKLHVHPVKADSVVAASLSYYVLGSINDPKFGTTTAALYTQVILPTASLSLGAVDSLRFDSLVLCIGYNSTKFPDRGFGKMTLPQTIKVYQVTDAMNSGNFYYSNHTFKVNPLPIGSRTFVPNFTDSFKVVRTKYPPHIRIRLDSTFGKSLMAQSSNGAFTSQADFLNFMQGLLIAPDTTQGLSNGLMYINTEAFPSAMVLHYRYVHKSGKIDTLTSSFPINNSGAKCNHFTHSYISSISSLLKSPVNDSNIYIQGLGGINTAITLPPLSYFSNKVINKAEVVITQVYDASDDTFNFSPTQLYLVKYDSLSHKVSLPDFNESLLAYGGSRNYITDPMGHKVAQYKISIAGYLQDVLRGKNDYKYGLFITNELNGVDESRLVANGNNRNANFRLKFNLIYTPIK